MQRHTTKLKKPRSELPDLNKIDLISNSLKNEDDEENIELIELDFTKETNGTSEIDDAELTELTNIQENIEKLKKRYSPSGENSKPFILLSFKSLK